MIRFYLICVVLAVCHSKILPSYFSKCSKSDPQLEKCLTKIANNAWPEMTKGDKAAHIQQLNPLYVPFVSIHGDDNSQGNLTDGTMTGLDKAIFHSVKLDFDHNTLDVKFLIPRVNYLGTYGVIGKVLFLPLEGHGPANLTMINMNNDLHIEFTLKNINNKQYIEIERTTMKYTITRGYFRLDNLFGGDKTLGEAMNKVLDESWEAVNEEIGVRVGNALGAAFASVLQAFFRRVPINNLFSE